MADRPELHGHRHSLGPPNILGKTMVWTLFGNGMSGNQGNDSSQQSSNSLAQYAKVPSKAHPSQKGPPNPMVVQFLKGVICLATVPATAPFERIYLLMQCQNEMVKSGHLSRPYVGMKDCFLRTIRSEGVFSLWQGSSVHVVRFLASEAVIFSCNKWFWDLMGIDKNAKYKSGSKEYYTRWFSMTVPVFLLLYPFDYGRTRLATDVKSARTIQFSTGKTLGKQACSRQFTGLGDVCLKTLKSDGIFGLYRGFSLRLLGCASYTVIANEIELSLRREKQKQEKRTLLATALPRCIIFSLELAYYPVYSVSRRMMLTSGEAEKYKGVADAFRQIVKREGFRSLYKGVIGYVILNGAKNATFALSYSMFLALIKPK